MSAHNSDVDRTGERTPLSPGMRMRGPASPNNGQRSSMSEQPRGVELQQPPQRGGGSGGGNGNARDSAKDANLSKKKRDDSPPFVPRSFLDRIWWFFLYPPQLGMHQEDKQADDDVEISNWKICCSMGGTSTVPQTTRKFRAARVAFFRRLLAEFIGTAVLVFAIVGLKIRANQPEKYTDALGATLGSGLCLSALIYCFGGVCGAHFNPAVTLAFFLRRSFPGRWVVLYWIAQFGGSMLAAGLVRSLFGQPNAELGSNYPVSPLWTVEKTLWVEVLFSTIFIFVILALSKKGGISGADAALGVGFTLFWVLLFMAQIDGGGVNPFRSLCVAIVSGPIDVVWPFVVGPLLGAIAAVGFMWLQYGSLTSNELQNSQGDGDE